jgi:hypothetical protein
LWSTAVVRIAGTSEEARSCFLSSRHRRRREAFSQVPLAFRAHWRQE